MIIFFIAIEVSLILLLFFLFGRKDYFSIAIIENSFRVRLIFIVLIFLPLLFLFALYTGKVGGVPFYITIINLLRNAQEEKRLVKVLTHVFLLIGLVIMPLVTVSHLCFGYRQFLRLLRKQKDYASDKNILLLRDVLKKVTKTTGMNAEPTFFLVGKSIGDSIPGFAGCGIVGKGKNNFALLVSEDFADLFRRDVLSETEIEAVFLHELSHVLHKDHFMPLWARSFVPSPAFTIATASCFLSLFFGFLRIGLSWTNIIVLTVLLFGIYLFRAIIMQVTAHAIREREYLADTRAAHFYNHSAELIEAIKKIYLFLLPTKGISKVSQFMESFKTYDEDEYIEVAHNFKEAFLGVKQRFVDFFLVRVHWYSTAFERIRAIREKRNVLIEIGYFLSPFSIIGLSFLAVLCAFFISASGSFLGMKPSLRQELSLFLSYAIAIVLIFLSCLPLRLTQTETLRKALLPASWKWFPLHFFISKFWRLMHLNNLFIFSAGILCLAINGVYIDFLEGLRLLFVYTMVSVLFVILISVRKLEKGGNKK